MASRSLSAAAASGDISRRRVLIAGLAGAAVAATPDLVRSSAAAALPLVTPFSSDAAYSSLGVCALPQLSNGPYRHVSQWMDALSQTGASYFRGMYVHDSGPARAATDAARGRNIKWGMTVCPNLSFPDADIVARVQHIAANAADRCLFIEGINEPNYVRGGGPVPADWARRTVAKQRVIYNAVKGQSRLAHVTVLGPKLQAIVGTESQYREIGAAGLAQYMDYAALACYPGGRYPYPLLDQRLGWIASYWSRKPAWITEAGYTNALAATSGQAVVPEDVSAQYAPSMLLEALDRRCKVSIFELLDGADAGAKDNTDANFGVFALQAGDAPPWRAKPMVSSLRSILSGLKDPGPAYSPARVPLSVTSAASDVRSTVTAKRDGSATVHLRRARDCWDPKRKVRLSVPKVAVTVETQRGTRTVMVDHQVLSVPL